MFKSFTEWVLRVTLTHVRFTLPKYVSDYCFTPSSRSLYFAPAKLPLIMLRATSSFVRLCSLHSTQNPFSDYSAVPHLAFASNSSRNFAAHYGALDVAGFSRSRSFHPTENPLCCICNTSIIPETFKKSIS